MPHAWLRRSAAPALFGLSVLGALALSHFKPSAPLLSVWIAIGAVLGGWMALRPGAQSLAARAQIILGGFAILVSAAMFSLVWASNRVASPMRLQFHGVYVEGKDTLRVGVGLTDLDVYLGEGYQSDAAWSVTLIRTDSGWRLQDGMRVDDLRLRNRSARQGSGILSYDDFLAPGSVVLSHARPTAHIRLLDGTEDSLRIQESGGRILGVKSDRFGEWHFTPTEEALANRTVRQLARGVELAVLDGPRQATAPYERFARVTRLRPNVSVNEPDKSTLARHAGAVIAKLPFNLDRYFSEDRVLLSSATPFPLVLKDEVPLLVPAEDTVELTVRSDGESWSVRLAQAQRSMSGKIGLSVLFHRHPRPPLSPVPEGESCGKVDGAACGTVSIGRLPPPIAHIALNEAGLDPERFGLLMKVNRDADGLWLNSSRDSLRLENGASTPSFIPVYQIVDSVGARRQSNYHLLLSARGVLGATPGEVTGVIIGLLSLLGATASVARRTGTTGHRTVRATDRPFALAMVAVLLLVLVRLILGARVTLYSPYEPRGLQTAIGLWVSVCVVTVGLLLWPKWASPLLLQLKVLSRYGPDNAMWHGAISATFQTMRGAVSGVWEASGNRPPLFLAVVGIVLLGIFQPAGLGWGLLCGCLVIAVWFVMAWTLAFSTGAAGFTAFKDGAWTLVSDISPRPESQTPIAIGSSGREAWGPAGTLPLLFASWLGIFAGPVAFVGGVGVLCVLLLAGRGSKTTAETRMTWSACAVAATVFGLLSTVGPNKALPLFLYVIMVALSSIRSGRWLWVRWNQRTRSGAPDSSTLTTLGQVALPLALLWPLLVIDLGLLLVVAMPIAAATLVASGWSPLSRRTRVLAAGLMLLGIGILWSKVLHPSLDAISGAKGFAQQASAYEGLTSAFGAERLPLIGPEIRSAMSRVASRAVATFDADLAQRLLFSAAPGEATDLLLPAVEQIWGARAYLASGPLGVGYGQGQVGGRGIAEAVSYAENSFAVYIVHEHGWIGGVAVICIYLLLLLSIYAALLFLPRDTSRRSAVQAVLFLAALLAVVPGLYVALANLSVVPLTGQNMPFLGLNAWSDVTFSSGLVGMLAMAALRSSGEG